MSWDPYVQYLKADNVCESAIIFAKADFQLLGSNLGIQAKQCPDANDPDANVPVNIYEQQILQRTFANKGVVVEGDQQAGLHINQEKYYTVHFDEELGTWYLKKNGGGACIAITNQCVLFGSFNSSQKMSNNVAQNASECNKRVEMCASNLKQQNY